MNFLWMIFHSMNIIYYIQSPNEWHIDYFWTGVIMSITCIYIMHVQHFEWICFFDSLCKYSGNPFLNHMLKVFVCLFVLFFIVLETAKPSSKVAVPICIPGNNNCQILLSTLSLGINVAHVLNFVQSNKLIFKSGSYI